MSPFLFLTSQQLTEAARIDRYPSLTVTQASNCRTGCPECYGKLNCGCPDCYVPEFKRGKKKRVSVDLESVNLLPRLEYSICTVSRVEEEERATLTKVTKPIVCTQVGILYPLFKSEFLNLQRRSLFKEGQGQLP